MGGMDAKKSGWFVNRAIRFFLGAIYQAGQTLKWDSKYELGNDRIDAEHRIFLSLIVDFHNAAEQDTPKDNLLRIFKEICKYAEFHFLSEENIMIDHRYPEQEHHINSHAKLLAEANNKLYQLQSGSISADDAFNFLFNWLAFHTSSEDKKLVGYIESGTDK
jgi:hemerythrin